MKTYWVPGVNNLGTYGRRAFAEFTEVFQMEADFEKKVAGRFDQMIDEAIRSQPSRPASAATSQPVASART
jgi:type III restriction enzyme